MYKVNNETVSVDPKLLINDLNPGKDDDKITWYPEPHFSFVKNSEESEEVIKGTFRSVSCSRSADAGTFVKEMCSSCSAIPNLPSFKKRLLLRSKNCNSDGKRNLASIRNDYLNSSEMVVKLEEQKAKLEQQSSQLFFAKSKNLRLRVRVRNTREKLVEYARRGSMKSICYKLQRGSEKGLLDDKQTLVGILESVSQNLHVDKNGKRYKAPLKLFLEVIMLWGGPRLATFVAMNICGPEVHSIYRWRNQHRVTLEGGIQAGNFKKLGEIYSEAMTKLGLSSIPVLAAEDETAIIAQVTYNETNDVLLGFCGMNGDNHQCLDHFAVDVGDGEEGYNAIISAFQECKIGSYARAIMLNPLHPNLPRLAILCMPTCNKFDTTFVHRQWQEVQRVYERDLEPVLGPLVGNSSDGDSRRRKIMLQLAGSNAAGNRFQPIPTNLGFVFSCRKEETEDGFYNIRDLCDQDFIHNHKKMLNPLDHATRVLMLGDYMVHMNHIQRVYDVFPPTEHGLGASDINRRDQQNWRSVQKLSFPKVRDCLARLIDGRAPNQRPNPMLLGTQVYLLVVWYYVEIFCSSMASLHARIKYAATVTHFLAIWHNYVHRHPRLTIRTNYITRETYMDILLSCHCAVLLICYMRDNFPNQECRLDLTGSDVLEDFWSKNGQWVGNHHNYNFGDLSRNTSHMIRLEQIRVDPNAPEFAKPHPKQESIWAQQYPVGFEKVRLDQYPDHGEEVQAWREGISVAQELARSVGMAPTNGEGDNGDDGGGGDNGGGDDDDSDGGSDDGTGDDVRVSAENVWFYRPFRYPGNKLHEGNASVSTQNSDEEEACNGGPCISGK